MAKILVVDDEPANRLLVAAVLRPLGHAVIEAESAFGGLEAAVAQRPDVTIVDLMMPDMHGTEFVRRFRKHDATATLGLLLYTASLPDAAVRGFMTDYRVAGVIVKPAEPHEISRAVDAALAQSIGS